MQALTCVCVRSEWGAGRRAVCVASALSAKKHETSRRGPASPRRSLSSTLAQTLHSIRLSLEVRNRSTTRRFLAAKSGGRKRLPNSRSRCARLPVDRQRLCRCGSALAGA